LIACKKLLLLSVLIVSFVLPLQLKAQSNCNVVASFSPGVDTFFTNSQAITFTSTSTNASSVQWRIDNFLSTTNNSLSHFFNTGITRISLIARNGNCTDTFSVVVVCTGAVPTAQNFFYGSLGFDEHSELFNSISAAPDGGFLVAASTSYKAPNGFTNGLITKVNKQNCIEWSKLLLASNSTSILQTQALQDGGFLVSGRIYDRFFLLRTNASGNTVWLRSYSSSVNELTFRRLYELADGSIIGFANEFTTGAFFVKLDPAGNVLWTRYLRKETFTNTNLQIQTMIEKDGFLFAGGSYRASDPSNNPFATTRAILLKMNPADGSLLWTNTYAHSQGRSVFINDLKIQDNYLLCGAVHMGIVGNDATPSLLLFDTNGSLAKSMAYKHGTLEQGGSVNVVTGVLPGGNIVLFFRGKIDVVFEAPRDAAFYFKMSKDLRLLQEQQSLAASTAEIGACFTGIGFAVAGNKYSSFLPWLGLSENLHFTKRDSSGVNDGCTYNTGNFSEQTLSLDQEIFNWVKDSLIQVTDQPAPMIQLQDVYTKVKWDCPAYVDSCSVLLIKGPASICNLSKTYTYFAGRNNQCPQSVEWSYEGNLSVIAQTDSSLTVRYSQAGNYSITAVLKNSCTPVADSIQVTVVPPVFTLNLGADRELCTGNSFVLHASPVFSSYRWQNGSTDSIFNVTAPGLYWVETMDNCANVWRDSVVVIAANGFSIDAGPDRTKCNADTLQLTAPAGYRSYKWTAADNLSFADTARSIVVNPLQSTQYYLQAEQNVGCFGFDTILVTVYQSPTINLGADSSICAGDSLQLTAPIGFASYSWSSGSVASSIKASLPGIYSLTATASNGCKSVDSLRILSNFPRPVVNIAGQPVICIGTTTELDAGFFNGAGYLWNNGETTRVISLNSTGIYSVNVTDGNGCSATDSFEIDRYVNPPQSFLSPDTSICNYSRLNLRSNTDFRSYLWSTNASTASIAISSSGIYTLTVLDENNCMGTDSIRVDIRECLTGCYVPTAFTPNRDGLNDVFTPLLFGDIRSYEFMVYNRWGQVIFSSKEPGKGWDGSMAGIPQNPGQYAWTCRYSFADGVSQLKSGTVLLMR
jgi:gliding motility-associated-like protein